MNFSPVQSALISMLTSFENQILPSLNAQQKKVAAVALLILSLIVSAVWIYRGCFRAKKVENAEIDHQSQDIINGIREKLRALKNVETTEALDELQATFFELYTWDANKTKYAQLFSAMLGLYGMRLYPQFQKAEPYLSAALQLQLQTLNVLEKENFSQIANLSQDLDSTDKFPHLIQWIKQANRQTYVSAVKDLAVEDKLQFATTLLYLGYVYSNLKEEHLNMKREPFTACLTELYYGIKNTLLSMESTPAIQEQLGELQYNIFPSFYMDQCKRENQDKLSEKQLFVAFDLLDQAYHYHPSLALRARIENLKACYIIQNFGVGRLDLAKQHAAESLKLWTEVLAEREKLVPAVRENYEKLYANTNNNYLAILMRMKNPDLEEVENYAKVLRESYLKTKEAHPYSMIHAYHLARLEKLRGKQDQALVYLEEIEELSKHYQTWPETKNCLAKAEALKKEIQAASSP